MNYGTAWGYVMHWEEQGWQVHQPVCMKLEDWPTDETAALKFIEEHVREAGVYKLFSPKGSWRAEVALRAEAA